MKTLLLICAFVLGGAAADEAPPLTPVQTIPLPGVKGRIDHFAYDPESKRLLVAALGNDTVEVIDLATAKVVHEITGLKEPQGILALPGSHDIVIANGDDGTVRFFAGATFAPLQTLAFKDDADNLRYDAAAKRIYVGFGGGAIGVIDADQRTILSQIAVDGHPEAFTLEAGGPRIFVNVPGSKQIAVIDRSTGAVTSRWDLGKGFSGFFSSLFSRAYANFPMALDEADHRLFVVCRRPARMLVFDTVAQAPVAQLDCSGDCDDVFYDAAAKRLYLSCGEGFIDVVDQVDADHYQRRAKVATAAGARTSWFEPGSRLLYLAVPASGSQAAEVRVLTPAR